VVQANTASREQEARRAREIIDEEIEKFSARLESRQVTPTIVSLQEHLENIRQAEIDRARGRLGRLTAEQELAIEALTRGIINKVLHTPVAALKSAAREARGTTFIDVVHKIFNLPADEANKNPEKSTAAREEEERAAASLRK
jgi:glutamyl-tRNA reductase